VTTSVATPQSVRAGGLEASVDAAHGLTVASLRHDGTELLGPLGIPFLHPWANRLSDPLPGLDVPRDDIGLPIHGVRPREWATVSHRPGDLFALLDFAAEPEIFPYAHRVTQRLRMTPAALRIDTTLHATSAAAVPIAFGFHPYFAIDRDEVVDLPDRARLEADERLIPTGVTVPEAAESAPLAARTFDDGYAVGPYAMFAIGSRLTVTFLAGYPFAQVFAPPASDFVCFEPMTAPTNALVTGDALRRVVAGRVFRASFEIRVG
jgi:aldose 1-epimerase